MKVHFTKWHFIFTSLGLILVLLVWNLVSTYWQLAELTDKEHLLKNRINQESKFLAQQTLIAHQYKILQNEMVPYLMQEDEVNMRACLHTGLLNLAQQAGLTISSLQPSKNSTIGSVNAWETIIHAQGTFEQWMYFLKNALALCMMTHVKSVQLQKEKGNVLAIKMTLIAFSVKSNTLSCMTHANSSEKKWHSIAYDRLGFSIQNNPFNPSLDTISLQQLKLVGYVLDSYHRWALALLPSHQVIAIGEGDRVGSEKGQVIAVDEEGILLKFNDRLRKMNYVLRKSS